MAFNYRLDVSIPGESLGTIGGLLRRGAVAALGDDAKGLTARQSLEELTRRMCKRLTEDQGERESDDDADRTSIDDSRADITAHEAAILARRRARRAQSDLDWA